MPISADADLPAYAGSDVVTPSAWEALAGSALGYAMDGFDLLILGFMLRIISHDLSLSPAQGASLAGHVRHRPVPGGRGVLHPPGRHEPEVFVERSAHAPKESALRLLSPERRGAALS